METIELIFGLNTEKLNFFQMLSRGVVVFLLSVALIRISGQRLLGKKSAFDHLATLIIGAILGRLIVTASQPFIDSLLAVISLIVIHRAFAWVSFKSQTAGKFFKGDVTLLMENGAFREDAMRSANITENDIRLALRLQMHVDDFKQIDKITLERSGEISFVVKNSENHLK